MRFRVTTGENAPMNTRSDGSDGTAPGIVTALVDSGIVAADDRERALAIVTQRLGTRRAPASGASNTLLATLLGYVGGILVVAAGAVFISLQWNQMSVPTRILALAGSALVLAIVTAVVRLTGEQPVESARRQLAGVLGLGASALAAGAHGVFLEDRLKPNTSVIPVWVFGLFTILAVLFYLFSPSLPGQLGIGFGLFILIASGGSALFDGSSLLQGIALLIIGLGWLALAEMGRWREDQTARLVGGALTLLGAQFPMFDGRDNRQILAYVLLTLVGVGAFAAYLRFREWPYLAMGVVGLTLAATEAAVDFIEGSGAAVGLLVAGVVLLITSLLALRLRRAESPTLASHSS